ncbi:DNA replication complex GINS protein PSF2 [Tupaia chinensis]|uniref:GINS complex subunit 2 n=1 Tax=Tupaia chinensis TaxID=246437 RepID=L9KJ19_TUPCH|nr:DNA replication complex GINS protein PSF2 [Tupaia chinensis]
METWLTTLQPSESLTNTVLPRPTSVTSLARTGHAAPAQWVAEARPGCLSPSAASAHDVGLVPAAGASTGAGALLAGAGRDELPGRSEPQHGPGESPPGNTRPEGRREEHCSERQPRHGEVPGWSRTTSNPPPRFHTEHLVVPAQWPARCKEARGDPGLQANSRAEVLQAEGAPGLPGRPNPEQRAEHGWAALTHLPPARRQAEDPVLFSRSAAQASPEGSVFTCGWCPLPTAHQAENLEKIKDHEQKEETFTPMPSPYYMELTKLLLNHAADNIPKADAIRTLIKDMWDTRLAKLRVSADSFVRQQEAHAKLDNLTLMEINAGGAFLTRALSHMYKLRTSPQAPDGAHSQDF